MEKHDSVRLWILACILCLAFSSCKTLFPSRMFETAVESTDSMPKMLPAIPEYSIEPHDKLTVRVLSNNGYELINVISTGGTLQQAGGTQIQYKVKANGYVRLPLIDSVHLADMTLTEAEQFLEKEFEEFFQDPFVIVTVINKRAFVYLGTDKATVVNLKNESTTLIEVLAETGGLTANNKAYHIKVISGDYHNPTIRKIDLSTIEGMRQADLIIRPNDIVYVEPTLKLTTGLLREITPYIGILTSFLIVYDLITRP